MAIIWLNITEKAAGMNALAARVGTVHIHDWTEDVAEAGSDRVREVITLGGMTPTKKGGPRIKSGSMIASVDNNVSAGGGLGFAQAGFGVKGGTPAHTKWQEHGTSRGIPAMMAIPQAQIRMDKEATDAGERMMARIAGEWDAI